MKKLFLVTFFICVAAASVSMAQEPFSSESKSFRFEPLRKSNYFIKDDIVRLNIYHKDPALAGKFSVPTALMYRYIYPDSARVTGRMEPLVMARPRDFAYAADICLKAKMDCKDNYKMWKASTLGTLFFTMVSPIASLSVAIPASLTPPRIENLGLSDVDMLQEGIYFHTYRKEAMRLKSKRTWAAYGIGLGIHIGAIFGILAAFN